LPGRAGQEIGFFSLKAHIFAAKRSLRFLVCFIDGVQISR